MIAFKTYNLSLSSLIVEINPLKTFYIYYSTFCLMFVDLTVRHSHRKFNILTLYYIESYLSFRVRRRFNLSIVNYVYFVDKSLSIILEVY